MYKNILVPIAIDHGPDVKAAIAVARALADDGAKITAMTVLEAVPAFILSELPEGQMQHNKDEAAAALKKELGDDITVDVVMGHAGRTITEYADSHGCDCIIIMSHQPGLQDYFLGSTAARVVRHAHCAVHVMR
ncbi:MAG: universal stress protein [Rhodobacteraceae bacterium]|jgi:nucleotide-binding universal stress UspA family protein|nr:universal stress protein [Alphaproteobacteria bacterium]NNF72023.1 universal stress protein [Paracoccaceae bacterium]NNK67466.1 universal stress protein [Paracoccaceae bacterium]